MKRIVTSVLKEMNSGTTLQVVLNKEYEEDKNMRKCIEIKLHEPVGEGDRTFCDCFYEDGGSFRMYDPNLIWFDDNEVVVL